MTLVVVPAVILPTVSTAGSATQTRRVIMVCSAPTMAAAAGTGSSASCGMPPWPPLPITRTENESDEAIIGPGRQVTTPDVLLDVICRANALVTGVSA